MHRRGCAGRPPAGPARSPCANAVAATRSSSERLASPRRRRRANASTAASAQAALLRLVRAVQRQEHLVVVAAAGPAARSSWPPTASSRLDTPNSRPSRATVAPTSAARRSSTSARLDRLLGQDGDRARLDDAGLLRRRSPRPCRRGTRVVQGDGVTTATAPSATLVASQVPPMPTSTTRDVDRRVGEHRERHAGEHLEERQPAPSLRSSSTSVEVGRDLVVGLDEALGRSTGSPSSAIRSRDRVRCGLVNRPVRSPSARSSVSIIRAVEVLPLVPVRWIDRVGALRVAEQRRRSALIRSRVGLDRVLAAAGEDLRLDLALRVAPAAAVVGRPSGAVAGQLHVQRLSASQRGPSMPGDVGLGGRQPVPGSWRPPRPGALASEGVVASLRRSASRSFWPRRGPSPAARRSAGDVDRGRQCPARP